jgi:hypothetical protein
MRQPRRVASVLLGSRLALAFDARAEAAGWFAGRCVVPSCHVPKQPGEAIRQPRCPPAPRRSRNAWNRALAAARLLGHRCKSQAGADLAPVHDWISSNATVCRERVGTPASLS